MGYELVNRGILWADGVLTGEVPAGRLAKLACERFERDIKASTRKRKPLPYYFDPDEAERWLSFLTQLSHVKGRWAGQPFDPSPYQCFCTMNIYGWRNKETKFRRFREAYVETPRKSGKSFWAAALGDGHLCIDGETGAEVYSGATSEKQAWEVFRPARAMLLRSGSLAGEHGVEINAKSMWKLEDGGRFEPIIGNPGDGASPSCAIVDEFHEHKTADLVDTMTTGMGARDQPLLLIITTAGSDFGGPCREHRQDVVRILERTITDETIFGIIFTIDSEPYQVIVQSSEAIERMDDICTCQLVTSTLIEKLSREVFARHAITAGDVPTRRSAAAPIQTDESETEDFAGRATNSGGSTTTPTSKRGRLKNGRNGQNATRRGSRQRLPGGEKKTKDGLSTSAERESTGSADNSTTNSTRSRQVAAPSAVTIARVCAWITATIPRKLEGCSVARATPQSVFSAILKAVFGEHSSTCEVSQVARINDEGLELTFPADDWTTEAALEKANPNLDISVNRDYLLAELEKAKRSPTKQSAYKTKHLNMWVGAKAAWMNMLHLQRCQKQIQLTEQYDGRLCHIGIDLASKIDIAALALLFPDGKKIDAFFRFYLPEEAVYDGRNDRYVAWAESGLLVITPGETIDFSFIEEDLKSFATRFKVPEVAYDPYQATQFSQRMMAEGLEMTEVRPTVLNFSEPMKELEARIVDRDFRYNDDVFTWMVGNVVATLDKKDNIYPNKERPENSIDGVVALLMAMNRWISTEDTSMPDDYSLTLV